MRPWDLPSFPGVTLMSGRAGPGSRLACLPIPSISSLWRGCPGCLWLCTRAPLSCRLPEGSVTELPVADLHQGHSETFN